MFTNSILENEMQSIETNGDFTNEKTIYCFDCLQMTGGNKETCDNILKSKESKPTFLFTQVLTKGTFTAITQKVIIGNDEVVQWVPTAFGIFVIVGVTVLFVLEVMRMLKNIKTMKQKSRKHQQLQ